MIKRNRRLFLSLLFLLLLTQAFAYAQQQQPERILILRSSNLDPFIKAAEAFKISMRDARIPHQISDLVLSESKNHLENIRAFAPDLIVPVGSTALKFAQDQFPQTPILFTMVLYPELSGAQGSRTNVTGVAMDIPLSRQFEMIRKIVPRAGRVGVIFNPAETGRIVEEAKKTASAHSLQLVAFPVKSTREVPEALDGIERRIDVLWTVADGTVLNGKMPELILRYTLQHNIAFMGLSPAFVEAGALFALTQDYADMGRQTAEMAIRVLAGAAPGDLPISYPRTIRLHLNIRSAEEIGVQIPPHIRNSAAKVIRP